MNEQKTPAPAHPAPPGAVAVASEQAQSVVEGFNEALALYRQGQWGEALGALEPALQAAPALVPGWLLKARCHVQLGQTAAALQAFADCLARDEGNYSAWLESGHLHRLNGSLDVAREAYARAIALAPQRHEALLGMARLLMQRGEHAQASQTAQHALDAAERVSAQRRGELALVLARYWLEHGRYPQALALFSDALKALPEQPDVRAEVMMDAAVCHLRLGRRKQAERLLSLASAAESLPTLSRLALLSLQNNFGLEAIEVMKRATSLYPQDAQAWANLAHVQAENWHLEDAAAALDEATSRAELPASQVLSIRAALAGKRGDSDAALAIYQQLAAAEPMPGGMASSAAMCSLYSDRLSAQAVSDLHRQLFARLGEGARARASFVRAPLTGRRIRLGLVSADFHQQHPVNLFMQPVLRELDRNRFEVFLYATGSSQDEQTRLAHSRVEHWVDAMAMTDAQLAARIDADAIDVLMDLSGHTSHNRMALFGRRAAPVQVSYLGYPGTTGVPNIDYLLGDAVVTPPEDDALCSETVLRLPGTVFCYAPEEDYPLPAFDAAMAQRALTFASFNNVPKLTPRTLRLWARVLLAVPGSRLLLKAPTFRDPGAIDLFRRRLADLGVAPERIECRGPVGLPDMMAEYADVDIALDPVPYNGGTTSLQALWMGVPVLTLHGHSFVSRMGASFMRAAGLPQWVARDEDDYVAIAQRMAADRAALLQLKAGLRQHLQTLPAWDIRRHTRSIEDALQKATSQHLGGAHTEQS